MNNAHFIFSITLSLWINFFWGKGDQINIILPENKTALTHISTSSITGYYDTSSVSYVQLLCKSNINKQIEVSTKELKDNFANEVRLLFQEGFIVEKIFFKFARSGGEEKFKEYFFSLRENYDLKKFWSSNAFKEMVTEAFEPKMITTEVRMDGWSTETRPVFKRGYRQRFKNLFSFGVLLTPGLNRFYIRTLNGAQEIQVLDSVRFFYSIELQSEKIPDGFTRRIFHNPESEKRCATCHKLDLSEDILSKKPTVEKNCEPCHQTMFHRSSSHVPASDWDCLMCHDPLSVPKYQLYTNKKYDASLCFECHSDVEEAVTKERAVHAPAGAGDCKVCHDLHSSGFDKLVVNKTNKICSACHDNVSNTPHPIVNHPLEGKPDPHRKGKELSCVSCHNPHASDHEYLLIGNKLSICQACHQK